MFALTLMLVAPLAAAPRKPAPKPAPRPAPEQKIIQSCAAHKFETVVDTTVDGQPHKSKVKLCGNEGQSDAEWIGTLKDAIRKLEANKDMAPATRDQIVAAIQAEIGRLSIVGSPAAPRRGAQIENSTPLSRDYAALPPMPPATAPTPPAIAEPQAMVPIATVTVPTPSTPAPAPAATMPRLTFICETPGDLGGPAPCIEFERETRVTIRSDGDVPMGTTLQFIRNGREQGDIALDGAAKGVPLRTGLPSSVCAGFGAGRLELRVVRGGAAEAEQSEGPYSLRC